MSNTPDPATPAPLASHPIHLGAGATAVPQPVFTGELDWYMGYGQRHGADGREGRLLSMHTLESPATTWEVHPEGSEVVLVVSGRLRLHQEHPDGRIETLVIDDGIPDEAIELCQQKGVKLEIVSHDRPGLQSAGVQ